MLVTLFLNFYYFSQDCIFFYYFKKNFCGFILGHISLIILITKNWSLALIGVSRLSLQACLILFSALPFSYNTQSKAAVWICLWRRFRILTLKSPNGILACWSWANAWEGIYKKTNKIISCFRMLVNWRFWIWTIKSSTITRQW